MLSFCSRMIQINSAFCCNVWTKTKMSRPCTEIIIAVWTQWPVVFFHTYSWWRHQMETFEVEIWGVCCDWFTFCNCYCSAVCNIMINLTMLEQHLTVLLQWWWKSLAHWCVAEGLKRPWLATSEYCVNYCSTWIRWDKGMVMTTNNTLSWP